jgi:hypothetical protein
MAARPGRVEELADEEKEQRQAVRASRRGADQVTLPAALSRGVSPSGLALVCRRR